MIELWDFGDPWNVIRDAVIWLGSGGETWSESNEDEFRLLAAAWRAVGEQLGPAVEGARGSAGVLSELWGGDSGAWFAQVWQQVGGDLPEKLFEAVGVLADSLDAAALDVEHTKLSTLLEVGIVITEIFVFAVMAWLSFGAAMTLAAARIGVTRLTVRQIFELLVSRAGASFTQRSGYAGLREMASGLRVKTLALAAGDEAVREGVVNLLPQLYQVKVLGTRESVDKHAVWVDAAAGAMGSLGSPVGDFGRTLAGKIDNGVVRGFSNIGADAASEWAEELLGNLGGSLADDGTFALRPPGFEQVAAGMARNYISNGARVGERVGSFVRGVVGLETPRQQLERQVREAREAAAQHQRDAQLAAVQARAAADAAQVRAQEAAAARDAARLAAGERSPGQAPSTSTSPALAPSTQPSDTQAPGAQAPGMQSLDTQAPGTTEHGSPAPSLVGQGLPGMSPTVTPQAAPNVAPQGGQPAQNQGQQQGDPVRLAEETADRAQRSADTAARQAQSAEQAAQAAREAVEQAARAASPAELQEAVRAAETARNEAAEARNFAVAHASIDTESAANPDATHTTNPTSRLNSADASSTTNTSTSSSVSTAASAATSTSQGPSTGTRMTESTTASPSAVRPHTTTSRNGQTAASRSDVNTSTPSAMPPGAVTPTSSVPSSELDAELESPANDAASLSGPDATTDPAQTPAPEPASAPVIPIRPETTDSNNSPSQESSTPISNTRPSGVDAQSGDVVPPQLENHDPPISLDQRRLFRRLPLEPDGSFSMYPDPDASDWVSWINDGGPFTSGRRFNCAEVVLAVLSTWRGKPRVAGSNRSSAGVDVSLVEQELGASFTRIPKDSSNMGAPDGQAGLAQIEAELRALGPGASAAVNLTFDGIETSHLVAAVVNSRGEVRWIDAQMPMRAAGSGGNRDISTSRPAYFANVSQTSVLLLPPGADITSETAPGSAVELSGRLAAGLNEDAGPVNSEGDAATEPDAEPTRPSQPPEPQDDDDRPGNPLALLQMVRVNTPKEIADIAAAIKRSHDQIRAGLAAADVRMIGFGNDGVRNFVQVETPDKKQHLIEVFFDSLRADQVDQVQAVIMDDGSIRVRIGVSTSVGPQDLANIVSERVVGAARMFHGRSSLISRLRFGPRPLMEPAALGAALQAVRIGDDLGLVRILAENNLLPDQKGARERIKRRQKWLSRMPSQLLRRLFDTQSPRTEKDVLKAVDKLLLTIDLSSSVQIRLFNMEAKTFQIRVAGRVQSVQVEVVPFRSRDYAIRLKRDPFGGIRIQVRSDASDAAIRVELAGVLAYLAYEQEYGSFLFAAEAAYHARARVLEELYLIATPAEREMLRQYVKERQAPSREDKAMVLESLKKRKKEVDTGRGLGGGRRRPRIRWPHYFRRLVSSLASIGNTWWVGPTFGREVPGMGGSTGGGLVGNLGQASADDVLGSPLPEAKLTLEVEPAPELGGLEPPQRNYGVPFKDNVTKRIRLAIGTTAGTFIAFIVVGGEMGPGAIGGLISLVGALGGAWADKLADPHEMTAGDQRKAMVKAEPESARNNYAESIYYLASKLLAEYDPDNDVMDRKQLRETLKMLDEAIADLEKEVKGDRRRGVEGKVQALKRRRSVVIEPAKRLWNRAVEKRRPDLAFKSPKLTYEMAHLPDARAPRAVNPLRVMAQGVLIQSASFFFAISGTPELAIALMLAAAARGAYYGAFWTDLSVTQARDAEAVAAAQALAHLKQARRRLKRAAWRSRKLPKRFRPRSKPMPQAPSGRSAIARQAARGHLAGVPRDEAARTQSRKHVGALGGVILLTAPIMIIADLGVGGVAPASTLTIGPILLFYGGQMLYTAGYATGEGVSRVVPVMIKRTDRQKQLIRHATRLDYTPEQTLEKLKKLTEAVIEQNKRILPAAVDQQPDRPITRGHGIGTYTVRVALATIRLAGRTSLGRHPGLRPGHNPPEGVLLGKEDVRAIDRLIEVAEMLMWEISARRPSDTNGQSDVSANATRPRSPLTDPTLLRGDLRLQMERLGLLVNQEGSEQRWQAIINDVSARYGGIDRSVENELRTLREDYSDWPRESEANRVREYIATRRQEEATTYALLDAINLMARDGLITPDLEVQDRAWHVRVMPGDAVRVVTGAGTFDLQLSEGSFADKDILAMVEPASATTVTAPQQVDRLLLAPGVIGDPARLAQVLDQVINGWLQTKFAGGATLLIFNPDGQGA
ncbi:WXG100-like domain-containing protein [Micromonospora sp. NPDC003197]